MTGRGNDGDAIEGSQARPRLHDFREEIERNTERVQHAAGPGAGNGVEHLRRRGIAEFTHLGAAQPVVEQIRNGQKARRNLQLGRTALYKTHHLIERIDRHELDAGLREHLCLGDSRPDRLHHSLCPAVPVADRVADEITVAVQEAEVHAPGVDGQAGGGIGCVRSAAPDAHLYFPPEVEDIPLQDTVDGQRVVGKAMHLLQLQAGAIKMHRHYSTGLCANIDGQNGGAISCHGSSCCVSSWREEGAQPTAKPRCQFRSDSTSLSYCRISCRKAMPTGTSCCRQW